MQRMVKSVALLILAVAIVPFLAEWHTPFDGRDAGIAYAKGTSGPQR